jgi:hypothetical protein
MPGIGKKSDYQQRVGHSASMISIRDLTLLLRRDHARHLMISDYVMALRKVPEERRPHVLRL